VAAGIDAGRTLPNRLHRIKSSSRHVDPVVEPVRSVVGASHSRHDRMVSIPDIDVVWASLSSAAIGPFCGTLPHRNA